MLFDNPSKVTNSTQLMVNNSIDRSACELGLKILLSLLAQSLFTNALIASEVYLFELNTYLANAMGDQARL